MEKIILVLIICAYFMYLVFDEFKYLVYLYFKKRKAAEKYSQRLSTLDNNLTAIEAKEKDYANTKETIIEDERGVCLYKNHSEKLLLERINTNYEKANTNYEKKRVITNRNKAFSIIKLARFKCLTLILSYSLIVCVGLLFIYYTYTGETLWLFLG